MKTLLLALEHTRINENGNLIESWPNGFYTDENLINEFIEQNNKIGNSEVIHNVRKKEDIENIMVGLYNPFISLFSDSERRFIKDYVIRGIADYKNLDEISSDEKYIFPIRVIGSSYFQLTIHLTRGVCLPQRVLEDVRNGKCKILFHQFTEGQGNNLTIIKQFLEAQSKIHNIPLYSMGYVDSNTSTPRLQSTYGSKGFFMPWWYNFITRPSEDYINSRYDQLKNPEPKDYYFLSLNRRVRFHRSRLIINIYNKWKDKTNWSYDKPVINEDMFISPLESTIITYEDILIRRGELTQEFYNSLPKTIDIDLSFNHLQINYELMDSAYINLTTETFYDYVNGEVIFLSEKIFKPILAIQPFIIVGNPYLLRELKNLGFKTFHPIINEEYDEIIDDDKRMENILQEIDRLYKLTPDEIKNFIKKVSDICIYNYKHLTKLYKFNIPGYKFCQELWGWLNEQ
jgi:hypothetical protein